MQNADLKELDKFSQLAHRWWDLNSEFRPLHDINPLRIGWINEIISVNEKKILDVGCGGGILAEGLAELGAQVTGIDLSEKALNVAKLHLLESEHSIDYHHIAAEDLAAQSPETYDIVTCMEMLEHVPDPASIVTACAALTRPGGHLFFSTLNRNPKSFLFAVIGAEYLLQLLPKGTHEYTKFIRPSELSRWAKNAGLSPSRFIGLSYNPITRTYSLGSDTSVNYLMHAVKPTLCTTQ